jgi:threonine/homoserine/homoserine lactone efflux protein
LGGRRAAIPIAALETARFAGAAYRCDSTPPATASECAARSHRADSIVMTFLLKGLAIGFAIAAPVGPIGVLCIRRSLAHGTPAGLASGLGAAVADAAYGCIAAFGLTMISTFLVGQRFWLQLAGGVFLCWLGMRTLLATPAQDPAAGAGSARGLLGAFASTFVLTLTNPMTILSFVAVFAGLGLADTSGDYRAAATLVAGVFLGSALWWLLLSGGVGLLRSRFDARGLLWVNRVSGALIVAFGVFALATLARG